ncbi:hypothetical protein TSOC_007085 [Tetrabaena socialis]|uniref:Uncharacterized protein n=1 Tax=Tetrabaena socialis TaxID=47790 RepID=A0A2J8A202_9CHLO|nr:hypothetical protein TSOC_007085 [Tetrabaena socialis]|eukprot:PNH06540.1 hypothetical protein TSOC_007085 [Tetrabaena socialis]
MARPRAALLPLLLFAFLAAAAAAGRVHADPQPLATPRRSLLLDVPCCEDCQTRGRGNDVAVFNCFGNCQNCVSGPKCLELSRGVAGAVAQVACAYAVDQCTPRRAAAAAAFQVTRQQCYRAAKNVCLAYGRDYAQNGGTSCAGYINGAGSCDKTEFRRSFTIKLNELCESISKGVAVSLP